MNGAPRLFITIACCVFILALLETAPLCIADDHKEGKKHFQKHDTRKGERNHGDSAGQGRDHGSETTGQMVAWSLGAVNLTIVISLVIRGIRKYAPLSQQQKNSIWKFNSLQKKVLMPLHYILNPLILAIALLHWSLSRCASTTMPEWGLIIMSAIAAMGIVLKFKLIPKSLMRNAYRVHTHPALVLAFVFLLLIGHLTMD